jgi:hypothetical protein
MAFGSVAYNELQKINSAERVFRKRGMKESMYELKN